MENNKIDMFLRNCYDSNGGIINETEIETYEPLRELLEMFDSLHSDNITETLETAS